MKKGITEMDAVHFIINAIMLVQSMCFAFLLACSCSAVRSEVSNESKSMIFGELQTQFLNNSERGFLMVERSFSEGDVFAIVSTVANRDVSLNEKVHSFGNSKSAVSMMIAFGEVKLELNDIKYHVVVIDSLAKKPMISYKLTQEEFMKFSLWLRKLNRMGLMSRELVRMTNERLDKHANPKVNNDK